jgi:hypothetical protein
VKRGGFVLDLGGVLVTRNAADVDAIASTAMRTGEGIRVGVAWTDGFVSSVSFCDVANSRASCRCIMSSKTCTGLACGMGRKPLLDDVVLGTSISSVITFLFNGTIPVFQNAAIMFSFDSACV